MILTMNLHNKLSTVLLFLAFAGIGCSAQTNTPSNQPNKKVINRENLRGFIPLGLDNIQVGMPLTKILQARKNVQTYEGVPIDPKGKNMYLYERVDLKPGDVYNRRSINYLIENGFLKSVNIVEYFDEKELASRTKAFLTEVIDRYGPPEFLKVKQDSRINRPTLFWYKNDTLVEASYTTRPFLNEPRMLGFVSLFVQAGSKAELMEKRSFPSLSQAEAEKFLLPTQTAIQKAMRETGQKPVGMIPVETYETQKK